MWWCTKMIWQIWGMGTHLWCHIHDGLLVDAHCSFHIMANFIMKKVNSLKKVQPRQQPKLHSQLIFSGPVCWWSWKWCCCCSWTRRLWQCAASKRKKHFTFTFSNLTHSSLLLSEILMWAGFDLWKTEHICQPPYLRTYLISCFLISGNANFNAVIVLSS